MDTALTFYAVAKGYVPGIYTSNSVALQQVLYYSGNCMKGFKTLAEAQRFMVMAGQAQQTALFAWAAPAAIGAVIALLAWTLYSNPEMKAQLLDVYNNLPDYAVGIFDQGMHLYSQMKEGYFPDELRVLGLNKL